MGVGSVTAPPADDGATEVNIPIGFRFGNILHHYIYVRLILNKTNIIQK